MPDDVRAAITALFPPPAPSPEQLRAASLAASPGRLARSCAEVLAGITAASPVLGDYARWIMATGARDDVAPTSRAAAEREVWTTMAALRVVAYRRETALLTMYLDEHASDAGARRRVLDLVVAMRAIERRFPGAAQRAQLAQAREADPLPPRASLPTPEDGETR